MCVCVCVRVLECVCVCLYKDVGRDGVVEIATRYGLGVSGFQPQCGRDFAPGAHLHNGCTGSFPRVKRPGRGVDHQPHLAPRLMQE